MLYSVVYTPPQGLVIYGIFYSPSPSTCTEYHADIRPGSNRFSVVYLLFRLVFISLACLMFCVYAVGEYAPVSHGRCLLTLLARALSDCTTPALTPALACILFSFSFVLFLLCCLLCQLTQVK